MPSKLSVRSAGCWPCRKNLLSRVSRIWKGRSLLRNWWASPSGILPKMMSPPKWNSPGAPQRSSLRVLADAIVEVTETGSSLRANGLRIIETVLESNTKFIANPTAWDDSWRRQKIEMLVMLLKGAIDAAGKVGLMLNVLRADLDQVLGVLPALKRADDFTTQRPRMGGGKHGDRGEDGAGNYSAPQSGQCPGNRRVSVEQDRALGRWADRQMGR